MTIAQAEHLSIYIYIYIIQLSTMAPWHTYDIASHLHIFTVDWDTGDPGAAFQHDGLYP